MLVYSATVRMIRTAITTRYAAQILAKDKRAIPGQIVGADVVHSCDHKHWTPAAAETCARQLLKEWNKAHPKT